MESILRVQQLDEASINDILSTEFDDVSINDILSTHCNVCISTCMTFDSSWSPAVPRNDILSVESVEVFDVVDIFDAFDARGGVDINDSISSVMGNVITTEI